jgi:hypothetical protein
MIEIHREYGRVHLLLQAVPMGRDWNLAITGGDIPHLGAVAVAVPRPSIENPEKVSATVSLFTLTGHKEDDIVRPAAALLAGRLNTSVVVSCGIHMEHITPDEVQQVMVLVEELLTEFLDIQNSK